MDVKVQLINMNNKRGNVRVDLVFPDGTNCVEATKEELLHIANELIKIVNK